MEPENLILGTDGDDTLVGTAADDLILTGNSTPNGDFVGASTGNDTIDFAGNDGENGFVTLGYTGLNAPISVTIDGSANTGTVNKGANGTDTLLNVDLPLMAGNINGGLQIVGTGGNDGFVVAPDADQWMALRPGAGVDSFTINGSGFVRLDFRNGNGIDINLATRQITNDGFGNAEVISGTNTVWEISGSAGNDRMIGSDANESFRYGGGGNNTVEGGGGIDRLRYDFGQVTSATVDLSTNTATGTLLGGGTFSDQISGFENVRGSFGNDTITGDATANRLQGRSGDDRLVGGLGNDTIDGEDGSDTAVLAVNRADATASAFTGGIQIISAEGTDFFTSVEFFQFDDTLISAADLLDGAEIPGEETVGTNGNDTLLGGIGDDTLNGLDGDDVLDGGAGNDLILTGNSTPNGDFVAASTGNDTIDFAGNDAENGFVTLGYAGLNAPISVTIDGSANTGTVNKGANGTDTLLNVDLPLLAGNTNGGLQIIGTTGNDSFVVAPDASQWMALRSGDGVDSFTINGSGFVRLDFRTGNGIDVNLATRQITNDGFGNAEVISGTNTVWEISGSAGNDRMIGSDANESFRYWGGGNNTVEGGDGIDRLRYDVGPVASVTVNLSTNTATGTLSAGGTFSDVISGFENLRGSFGDDTLIGDDTSNLLQGRAGDDRLEGGLGNDTIDGEDGNDTAVLAVARADTQVSVINGGIQIISAEGTDFFTSVEFFQFDDTLISAADLINGAGITGEVIVGTDGDDSLIGTVNDDTLAGGDGNDNIDSGGGGNNNISGSDGNDTLFGGPGDDSIGGGLGDDTIFGNGGNDVLGAGFGNDFVSGGNGNDVVAGGAGDDTLEGGEGNDSMSGSFGNDLIFGNGGADDIGGGTGRDTIDAGAGNDSVGGGEGDDSIDGGDGNDFLAGGGRNDVIDGGAGNDTINAGAGNDTITGGTGADQFVFSSFFDGEADIITDFEDGLDSFFIRRFDPDTGVENINNGGNGLAGFVAAMNIVDVEGGAQMTVNGNTILVEGITAAQLTVDDFTFL
ncbi:Bifunctional hemolysin/adenylate cyclase (modular protein) [Roseovarius sp. EC-HK134]|uniref:calcium-binding protein n=1 Tax=unclassified Roseovarius TaxID=2614913 RepID=UPI001255B3B7|nr:MULTISPECIES: calcium-binding protein [unclassified Roseovarius]VVT16198.1 Bifunctional hemolysin/adenylate cyclase (modular protein) [Roseovarius sp. EC-HK134]VVT16798.1 Bifunctional hemolysin/adenylate cyclase (modular protein) [Roseovarius sp. EC-SD190]